VRYCKHKKPAIARSKTRFADVHHTYKKQPPV